MKKTLLICGALLALTTSLASAQGGINLSWNDCGTFGAVNKTFACNTNGGTATMTGSFMPPQGVTNLTGEEMVLDLQENSSTLSSWWSFKNPGSCRLGSASANIVFPANCADYYGTAASPTIGFSAYQSGFGGPNKARVKLVSAVSASSAGPADPLFEYYSFNFVINYQKSIGTGSCGGCLDGVCIVLNEIKLAQPNDGLHTNVRLFNALQRQHVLWQGGGNIPCAGATPAQNKTWGSVKALYH